MLSQRMRIGRRASLMQRHSPLGRPRPLAALQVSLTTSLYPIVRLLLYKPGLNLVPTHCIVYDAVSQWRKLGAEFGGDENNVLPSPQIEKFGGRGTAGDSLYFETKCWLNGNLLANYMV